MSKSALILKSLIIVSFIGLIVFLGVAIISNQSISYEAYNYVASAKNKTEFNSFLSKVKTNMKSFYSPSANGNSDEYSKFLCDGVVEINSATNYYLDFLATGKDFSKGEQDNLKKLYDNYLKSFDNLKTLYDEFISSYQNADYLYNNDTLNSDYAISIVKSQNIFFVNNFAQCVNNGCEFVNNLTNLLKKYSLPNGFSYKGVNHLLKVGFISGSIDFILENMQNRTNMLEYVVDIKEFNNVDAFYDLKNSENTFNENDTLNNSTLCKYLSDINSLNIYLWSKNYDEYSTSLLSTQDKEKSESAFNFFYANYRE